MVASRGGRRDLAADKWSGIFHFQAAIGHSGLAMRTVIDELPASKIREVANAGHGPQRRAGLLVRRKRRGRRREFIREAAMRLARRAARPSTRTTWACPSCARRSPATSSALHRAGRQRPHRRHLVGRQRADAGDAGAGRRRRRGRRGRPGLAQPHRAAGDPRRARDALAAARRSRRRVACSISTRCSAP